MNCRRLCCGVLLYRQLLWLGEGVEMLWHEPLPLGGSGSILQLLVVLHAG
jgi:hypothetical protein